jgi:polysaccharide deacetylase 2 family uncharacterized protein YibQ
MKKNASSSFLILLLIIGGIFAFYKFYYIPKVNSSAEKIRKTVDNFVVRDILIDPLLIVSKEDGASYDLTARMPVRFTADSLKLAISKMVSGIKGATVTFSGINNDKALSVVADIESPFAKVCRIRFVRNFKPKIAVILDDWGYHSTGLPYLASIRYPFTVSVLPGLRYTKEAADTAYKNKKGIMLHLPMQPIKKMKLEKITILAGMDRNVIISIVDKLADEVPHYTGVNNHEGSLVTADKSEMTTVLQVLQDRGYFFIDSMTTAKTVAYQTARDMGLRWGKRDIFIDNQKQSEYNELQIIQLKSAAKKKGWAIGIGHDDPVTLATLSKMMPQIEAEGFEFVYAAELLQ